MGVSCLKEQCQCRNFCFDSSEPYKFVRSQWRIPHGLYVLWRVVWAMWHIFWIIRTIQVDIEYGAGIKWLIYLTNYAYLVLTLQSIIHAIVVFHHWSISKMEPEDFRQEKMAWYLKFMWLLTSLGFDLAIVISVLYWNLVFKGTNSDSQPYIYKSLNWSQPEKSAILSLGSVVVAVPLVHLLQFSLYNLRVYMNKSFRCRRCGDDDSGRKNWNKPGAVQEEDIELV